MTFPETPSDVVPGSRNVLAWLCALAALALLVAFGLDRTVFWPVALAVAGAAAVTRRIPGRLAGRIADGLAVAAVAFPLVALGAALFAEGLNFVAGMRSPLAINPIEGREAYKAWLLAGGRDIYAGPGSGRDILVTLYGPLYYALAALAERGLGPGLFPARLVSLAAMCALFAAVFALVRRETGSVSGALAAVCALFAAPLLEYGHFARPDMTAWAFFFLTVWAFCRVLDTVSADAWRPAPAVFRPLGGAVLLAVCALCAKQQTWPPLFGLFLYGFLRRRLRTTVLFGLSVLVLGGAVFLGLDRLTHGGFLFQTFSFPRHMADIADMNSTASSLGRIGVFARLYWPDLLLLAGLFISAARRRRVSVVEPLLLACAAPLFVVLRWTGAEYNHFLPVVILAKAAGGILLGRLLEGGIRRTLPAVAVVLALLVNPAEALAPHLARFHSDASRRQTRLEDLRRTLDDLPGAALSDAEAAYLFLGLAPREVAVYDAFETTIFERLGLLRPEGTALARDIRDRRFALVLTTPTFQPKALVSLLDLFYRAEPTAAGPILRRPRPEPAVLGLSGPQAGPETQAGVTVAARTEGLEAKSGYVTADGLGTPGRLVVELSATRPLRALSVVFFPRLNLSDPGARLRLETEDAGGGRALLWSRQGGGPEAVGWAPEPGDRTEVAVPADMAASTRRLVFTLTGPSQLWLGPSQPLLVAADPAP